MAEPARRLDDDDFSQVYDQPGNTPSVPQLKSLEGGGETTEPKRGHLKPVSEGSPSRDELSKAERAPHENQVGSGYKPGATPKTFLSRFTGGRNRKFLYVGGAAALIAGVSIAIFLALLPLKILHIVNNLQSHFFATSENAVQKETDVMFSDYIKNYVLPGLNTCKAGSTIDRSCTPREIQGNTLVSKLYSGWRTARLENNLANKYGLEFRRTTDGSYYIKAPGLTGNGVNINGFIGTGAGETLDDFIASNPAFQKVSRSEVRQAVRSAFEGETRYKKVMYRFKVGRLLEQKYGIKRCIVFCSTADKFDNWKNNKKNAAKIIIAKRIIEPRNEMLGLVLQCLLSDSCDLTPQPQATESDIDGCKLNCETNGAPMSKTESEIRQQIVDYAGAEGLDSEAAIKEAEDLYQKLSDNGYLAYITDNIVKAAIIGEGDKRAGGAKQAGKAVIEKIPIIGAVFTASHIVGFLNNAGPALQQLSYVINTTTMAQTFSMYRTYADEVKTGKVDATIVGSFTDSLGPGNHSDNPKDAELGGAAEAEQTPLYDKLIAGGSGQGIKGYTCKDGNPLPAGQLVCPELKVNNVTAGADALNALRNNSEFRIISSAAGVVNSLSSWLSRIADWFLSIVRLDSLLNFLLNQLFSVLQPFENLFNPLIKYLEQYILPPPLVSTNTGGGRMFDVMAGGADVSGNDFAHDGLGGKKLTDQQTAAIVAEQNQQALDQYKQESFFARMFDTSSDYSPATKVAMALPSSGAELRSSLASLFSNPFGKIGNSFISLLSFRHAFAAGAQPDPFGIAQYGYTGDESIFKQNPDAFWSTYCVSKNPDGSPNPNYITDKWNSPFDPVKNPIGFKLDPETNMPENDTSNPCLLIQSAVGSAGGLYQSDLLTPDDLSSQ